MSLLQQIKQKNQRNKGFTDEDFIAYHDVLIQEYGWISIDELRRLPIPTFLNLLSKIGDRRNQEKKQSEKLRRKR